MPLALVPFLYIIVDFPRDVTSIYGGLKRKGSSGQITSLKKKDLLWEESAPYQGERAKIQLPTQWGTSNLEHGGNLHASALLNPPP